MTQSLIVFKPYSPIDNTIFESSQWLKNLLNDQDWDVGRGRYEVLEGLQIFENVQTMNLKHLKLRWTSNETIVFALSHISFPYLKELFLNGNNLTSLEPITQASFPALENLNLKQNFVTSIGSLRRCQLPCLKEISLYKNKIQDVQKLTQMNSPNLEKIWYNGNLEDGNIVVSITWLAKLESKKLKSFIIQHNQRINEDEAHKKMEQKFEGPLKDRYVMQDDRLLNWL